MTQLFEGEGPLTLAQTEALSELTRGNAPDRSWPEPDKAGNFYASVYDRRRLAVAAVALYAETNRLDAVPGLAVKEILVRYFAIGRNATDVIKNFLEWKARTTP